jgi:hypothetical protein
MPIIRSVVLLTIITSCSSLFCQEQSKPSQRDPALLDVLTRVVNTAGGVQALASVHDLTESGEITFHWGKGVKGPVTIRSLGGNHFRMEADLPEGKRTWLVNDGYGITRQEKGKPQPISSDNAINLGNLTFPIVLAATALGDAKTEITLVGIEKKDGRSIYRLRLKGEFGLSGKPNPTLPVVKDLLVDALEFNIVDVEDRPFHTYQAGGKLSDKPSRTIEYGDFRSINGVSVPFSISVKLMGQPTLSIQLNNVALNGNLSPADFKN